MFKFKNLLYTTLFISLFISACKKEDGHVPSNNDIDPNRKGKINIEFDNRVGNLNLVLDSPFYANALNQDFSINKFDYFISNIILINENGTEYTIPQDDSYFLVKENILSSREITLSDIPEGNYSGMRFTVGVDSLRSTMNIDKRTGALDPTGQAAGMYWQWNSGYIFLKLEGNYIDTPAWSPYKYHIGGFGGYSTATINNLRTVTVTFPAEKAEVRELHGDDGSKVHVYVDALKVLNGVHNVDFTTEAMIMMPNQLSLKISENYREMFRVDHVHNHDH